MNANPFLLKLSFLKHLLRSHVVDQRAFIFWDKKSHGHVRKSHTIWESCLGVLCCGGVDYPPPIDLELREKPLNRTLHGGDMLWKNIS